MPRNLSTTLQSDLAGRKYILGDLVELHLDTPVYFTNGGFDITWDSPTAPDAGDNTYTAQGQFIEFSNVSETADVRVGTIDLTFTAVDLTTVALVLNNDYINKRVVIYRIIFNDDYTFDSDNVFQFFDGRITDYSISETQTSVTLTITCATQFADFEKLSGRKTNDTSQKLFFANDDGMEFASQIVKEIKWGRA